MSLNETAKKHYAKEYKEEFTRCDTCENLKECVADGKLTEVTTANDKSRHFMKDIVFGCKKDLETLKKYGIELGGETKHSDPIRQTVKEVAEEMPALGKYDGDYAFPCGAYGYMDGLYRVDFSCSNCGKRHEGVVLGTEIACDCGKKIDTSDDD